MQRLTKAQLIDYFNTIISLRFALQKEIESLQGFLTPYTTELFEAQEELILLDASLKQKAIKLDTEIQNYGKDVYNN